MKWELSLHLDKDLDFDGVVSYLLDKVGRPELTKKR